jgi:hypothetical protein
MDRPIVQNIHGYFESHALVSLNTVAQNGSLPPAVGEF